MSGTTSKSTNVCAFSSVHGGYQFLTASPSQVADVFVLLYEAILEGKNTALGHGREGYYFASNGVHPTYSITKAIGSALVKLGKIKSAEPTSFAQEEVDKYFGPFVSLVLYPARYEKSDECIVGGYCRQYHTERGQSNESAWLEPEEDY